MAEQTHRIPVPTLLIPARHDSPAHVLHSLALCAGDEFSAAFQVQPLTGHAPSSCVPLAGHWTLTPTQGHAALRAHLRAGQAVVR